MSLPRTALAAAVLTASSTALAGPTWDSSEPSTSSPSATPSAQTSRGGSSGGSRYPTGTLPTLPQDYCDLMPPAQAYTCRTGKVMDNPHEGLLNWATNPYIILVGYW